MAKNIFWHGDLLSPDGIGKNLRTRKSQLHESQMAFVTHSTVVLGRLDRRSDTSPSTLNPGVGFAIYWFFGTSGGTKRCGLVGRFGI